MKISKISIDESADMASLARRYENFYRPAVVVKVDGQELEEACGAKLLSVNVKLTVQASASAEFEIAGNYDLEARRLDSRLKNKLCMGSKVTVAFGYGSELKEVFYGFICSIGISFQDMTSMRVVAMDLRKLLAENSETRQHKFSSYSDLLKSVLQDYKPMYESLEIARTTKFSEPQTMRQKGTDAQFLRRICENADLDFIMISGSLYFKKKENNVTPLLTLEWGKELISFQRNNEYKYKKIVVTGMDEAGKKLESNPVEVKSSKNIKNVISKIPTEYIEESRADTQELVQNIADHKAREEEDGCQSGSGSCIGIPELIPGRYIKLVKLDPDLDGSYYITSVSHSFGTEGYQTEFEIGGYK